MALGWANRFRGDLVKSNEALKEASDIGIASGNKFLAVSSTCRRGFNQILAGALKDAEQTLLNAVELAARNEGGYTPLRRHQVPGGGGRGNVGVGGRAPLRNGLCHQGVPAVSGRCR